MRTFASALAAFAWMAAPAAGAKPVDASNFLTIPGDFCGQLASANAEPLKGKWLVVNREGAGKVGSRGIALNGKPKENVELIDAGNGVLTFVGSNDMGPQRLDLQPQPLGQHLPNEFNAALPNGKIVSVNIASLLPCDWEKMPSWVGHIDYPLPGVGEMRMKVILDFPNADQGFGALHFTGNMMGGEIDVWRYITMTRKEK